ncbi:MAG: hypothetical protein ACRDZW_06315, partial [Acidimicrobiales bacterium]
MLRRLALVTTALLVMAGCAGDASGPAAPVTTARARPSTTTTTTTSVPPTSAAPSTTAPVMTTAAPGPAGAAAGTCPAIPDRATPRADRTRYDLAVDVRPAENLAQGLVRARFTPDLDTDRLVFRLWPNGPRTARAGAR